MDGGNSANSRGQEICPGERGIRMELVSLELLSLSPSPDSKLVQPPTSIGQLMRQSNSEKQKKEIKSVGKK